MRQARSGRPLPGTNLERHEAGGTDQAIGLREEPCMVTEAFGPFAKERERGLVVAHLRRELISLLGADVRRIRDQEAQLDDLSLKQWSEQIAAHEFKAIRHAVALRVPPGHLESGGREVGGDATQTRSTLQDGDGHATGAGAGIREQPRLVRLDARQHQLDEMFGFRARDQDIGRHLEGEAKKLSLTEDLRHRLPLASTQDEPTTAGDLVVAEGAIQIEVQIKPLHPECMRNEQLRIESGALHTLLFEPGSAGREKLTNGAGTIGTHTLDVVRGRDAVNDGAA